MGIRTKGFTKASSQKSGDVGEEKKVDALAQTQESAENQDSESKPQEKVLIKQEVEEEESVVKTKPVTRASRESVGRSPLKIRTPVAMARLGGMKVAARKLKKHRKRSLFVQSATKILRSSIKSNKTRRAAAGRLEEKPRTNGTSVPSRISTRTCVRRNSREGIPESPLRTVELIKRPLELREPATKLLYMASLGLYPRTGDSDMTPIVVIRELNCSPGKKNGVRKSLELPLIPQYHKRFLDLANSDKHSLSENIKPAAAGGAKQLKRDSRKSPPAPNPSDEDVKKPASGRKTPVTNVSPPPIAPEAPKTAQVLNSMESGKSNVQQAKKKTPPPKSSGGSGTHNLLSLTKQASTLDLTITPALSKMSSSSFTQEVGKMSPNSNSKSLLKTNISPPLKQAKDNLPFSLPLNLTASFPAKVEVPKPITTESLLASACSVTQAMNLIMSNITIMPSNATASRKRAMRDTSDLQMEEFANSKNFTIHNTNFVGERNPPKKKQKVSKEKSSKFSLSAAVPSQNSVSPNSSAVGGLFLQSAQSQNTDDQALNLCMKKVDSEPFNTPALQLPPKLQMNSNISIQKEKINGSKPLNLIIPRPPPLLKAPLEVTNFGNCVQNIQPAVTVKPKVQQKKTRKPRSSNNHLIQSNLQIQESLALPVMPTLPSLPLLAKTDTTVHAKSLLKCMNGEENTCVREIGESLDSVKTMLSRLQTRIGPAVNGVRLITIE